MSFQFRDFPIIGHKGGGGKGKGGGSSSDSKNTLRSKARAQLVELICEGPIKGLVNGDRSIFFGETALMNANGTYNTKNVVARFNRGLPDDQYFAGNTAASTPYSVEAQVKRNVGPVIRTVIDPDIDAVKVVIRIPSLFQADKEDGSIKTASLAYQISYRSYNGNWVVAVDQAINNEKTTSVYQKQHMINLPAGGAPWDIKVERITADSEDDKLSNELWWESYYTIINGKFIYPNTAALYIEVNAEDIGSSVPPRAVEVYGMIVKVPTNYDPDTRQYYGIWNGSFKYAYTNNPAWVFYDLITQPRYGLGEFVDETKVDKWSLYQIAQYCDQMVDTGFTDANGNRTQEPRYTFNGVINTRQEAFNVLRQIATSWRGMAFWSLGQVFATADMPSDPKSILTPANVIRGEFEYSGVALKATHSVALISWNDPADFYRPAVEVVINEDLLKKYGWREKQVTLVGCTSRGLAHRYGKWILDTEQHEDQTVSYSASWDQIDVKPGDIVAIADPNKAEIRHGGRLVGCSPTSAILDSAFKPLTGHTYSIMMVRPSGQIVTLRINDFLGETDDGFTVVNFDGLNDDVPMSGAMWVIIGSDINPRRYRILTVREDKPNEFKFTGLFHDPTKYVRVESGVILEAPVYTRPKNYLPAPTNLTIVERRAQVNGVIKTTLLLSWSMENDFKVKEYVVTMDHPLRGNSINVGSTSSMSMEVEATAPGVYRLHVRALGYVGNYSDDASFAYEVVNAPLTALPIVENLVLSEAPGFFAFSGTDVRIQWENYFATSSDVTSTQGRPTTRGGPLYRLNKVRVVDTATNTVLRDQVVTQESFTYSFGMNVADNNLYNRGPSRAVTFFVTVVDVYNRESLPKSLAVSNPPPAKIVLNARTVGEIAFVDWALPTDTDFVGSVIHASKAPSFAPDVSNLVFDGLGNNISFKLPDPGVWFIKGAAFDRFGKSGLNYSDEVQVVSGSLIDTTPPAVPANLAVTSVNTDGRVRVHVTWDANTEADLAGYDLLIRQDGGNFVSFPVAVGPYEFDSLPGITYGIKIRARDIYGNASNYTDVVTHIAAVDTDAPDAPTSFTVTPGVTSLWLEWVNPAATDLAYVEILEGTTNDATQAEVIASAFGTSFARTGLGSQVERFYWLRAVDTSGNKSALTATVSATTASVPPPNSHEFIGLLLQPNSPDPNKVSWAEFTASYGAPGAAPNTRTVTAGSFTWTTGALYIYYVEGETALRSASTIAKVYLDNGKPIAVYRGGTNLRQVSGEVVIDGNTIAAGTIGAEQLIANSAIITGAVQIKDAIITSAKIVDLDAAKIRANTVLTGSVRVGTDTLATIRDRAADPVPQINAGATLIDPGRIVISGATTLADWRKGGDVTKINGGAISANTIKANSLEIGLRNIATSDIIFEYNKPAVNSVSWTAGYITFIGDDGSITSVSIAAGNAAYNNSAVFLYWTKGETTLRATTTAAVAFASDCVVLARYSGGSNLEADYGRTIIDGNQIKTGTIQAAQIAANAIAADKIAAGVIAATHLAANAVTADKIAAGAVTANKISAASLSAISAVLGNVDISNAYIGNLIVGTSNIAGGAITSVATTTGGQMNVFNGDQLYMAVAVYHGIGAGTVLVWADFDSRIGTTGGQNGSTGYYSAYIYNANTGASNRSKVAAFTPPYYNTSTTVYLYVSGSNTVLSNGVMIAMAAKR